MRNPNLKKLLAPTLLSLAMFAGATQAAAPLRPPQGYFAPIEKVKTGDKSEGCDAMPTPYTGSLQFRSKYEGSDKARSTLNVQSEKAFRDNHRGHHQDRARHQQARDAVHARRSSGTAGMHAELVDRVGQGGCR